MLTPIRPQFAVRSGVRDGCVGVDAIKGVFGDAFGGDAAV